MRPEIHIQSQIKEVTKRLQRLHKSDYPLAVRGALNDASENMKKKYLPETFKKTFTIRRSTFLKSHSGFTKCRNTFYVAQMFSEAGIMEGKSISGDRLELQERGGQLNDRSIPFERNGVSPVRTGQRLNKRIKEDLSFGKFKGLNVGVKNFVIVNGKKIYKSKKGAIMRLTGNKNKPFETLYTTKKTAKIEKNAFIDDASIIPNQKIPEYFFKQAQKRFSK